MTYIKNMHDEQSEPPRNGIAHRPERPAQSFPSFLHKFDHSFPNILVGITHSSSLKPALEPQTRPRTWTLTYQNLRLLSLSVESLTYLSRWSSVLRILSSPLDGGPLLSLSLTVEHLKVRVYLLGWGVNSRACLRILNSRAPKGPYGRAPKGP